MIRLSKETVGLVESSRDSHSLVGFPLSVRYSNTDIYKKRGMLVEPKRLVNRAECWLDTELANTDKERSVVVAKGGAIIVINFNSKLVQSKE
jgi:hypothetical protein